MLSIRDPIHGFIRADRLEEALINSRAVQRLRFVRQLGLTFLVFPGAEHSRFAHVLGAMELAGRLHDALVRRGAGRVDRAQVDLDRRLVRAAALVHDLGHAPFSHSAEGQFEEGIDHEEMSRRILRTSEIAELFARHGEGLDTEAVIALLAGDLPPARRYLAQIVSGELDVDKMDYLLRDSLCCGVRYGSYDLERLLDTVIPIRDPDTGAVGIGVAEGGVHSLEALVLARYYMFTQVYFNLTGKALEGHLSQWLIEEGRFWPGEPEAFLAVDDLVVFGELRRSPSPHARAVVERRHYPLAFESREHLSAEESARLESDLSPLLERFGGGILVARSAKDPHRLSDSRVLVERENGEVEPMEAASHFIRHLRRIDRYRIYARPEIRDQVAGALRSRET